MFSTDYFSEQLNELKAQITAQLTQKKILNIDEVSSLSGLSKSTIYKMCSSRKIPYFKQAKHNFFLREDIEKWLLQNKVYSDAEVREYGVNVVANKNGGLNNE